MQPTLVPGLTVTRSWTIDRERTIDFMGEKARVYATPMLVRDIEVTARDLLLAHLDPGEDSVGTRVEIDHLAATLMGMKVDVTVTVAAVAGRAVTLDVAALVENGNVVPVTVTVDSPMTAAEHVTTLALFNERGD